MYIKCLGEGFVYIVWFRYKEIKHLWTCDTNRFERSRNIHSYPWSYYRIQVTEWFRIHWVRLSTTLPILRISPHFDRMPCYHICPLLPRSHELLHLEHLVLVGLFPPLVVHTFIIHLTIYNDLVSTFTCQNETLLQVPVVLDIGIDNWLSKDGRCGMFVSNEYP